jgi:hypothetical protein
MPVFDTEVPKTTPSIVPSDVPTMSDDECLRRLAQIVEEHDSGQLDEAARLIGRLAVAIE